MPDNTQSTIRATPQPISMNPDLMNATSAGTDTGRALPHHLDILPNDPVLRYTGRVDFDDPLRPVLIYPYTQIAFRFQGTALRMRLVNRHNYWENSIGVVVDGCQRKVDIPTDDREVEITLIDGLTPVMHDVTVFKRQDACHHVELLGFTVTGTDAGVRALSPADPRPALRMEVYGDSVSAGEVAEALHCCGATDPADNNGQYSNSWYSYAAFAARKLNAELHDIAQGGIALLPGTGWFNGPDYVGLEDTYDKLEYNPTLGDAKPWDFSRFTPHVVVVAIGQNDNHPDDYMARDYHCEQAEQWRTHYQRFVGQLRERYPRALIVLSTTILCHDVSWDRSIDEVCERIDDPRIVHFLYSDNGSGTPGHIRIPEAERMGHELADFIAARL
ncbi:SGNH/GDSL hydrolase family protein [Bifidobacterium vansinderenii]|uniref:Electron transporter RnfD n=1 Tax=Bifidobacterium vansinderenii TaxID=1984871 RepID=A0A229VWE9_9BIFI|nr:GDSL-type esterase/lipase family protein [Bifidobacterium vansinderenii]OXM99948.1 electron transporter RnfD [Bifidobacterium vansinderenii]